MTVVCNAGQQLPLTRAGRTVPTDDSQKIAILDPGKEDAPEQLKEIERYINQNRFKNVIPLLAECLKSFPNSARAHYDLGYVLFRSHKIGDSIREMAKSLELDPTNAEAHKILGLDWSIIGKDDVAETELQQASRLKPDSAEIHYLLGRVYHTRGVHPLAKQEFEAAIRLSPSYMKAYNNLGLTMEILGENDEAVRNYNIAARLNEQQQLNSPWPYEYLSAFYNRHRQPEQAIEFAQKGLSVNPQFDLAYFQMAKAYQSQGEWQKCLEATQKAISINSRTPDYYYVLSIALRRLGKIQQSEAALATFQKLHQNESTEIEHWRKARESTSQSPLNDSGKR